MSVHIHFRFSFCSGVRSLGTIVAQTFVMLRSSCKTCLTVSLSMFTISAISHFCYNLDTESTVNSNNLLNFFNIFICFGCARSSGTFIIFDILTTVTKSFVPLKTHVHMTYNLPRKPQLAYGNIRWAFCSI
jgi:hypothetical protein